MTSVSNYFQHLQINPSNEQLARFESANTDNGINWVTYDKEGYLFWAASTIKILLATNTLGEAWNQVLLFLEGGGFEDTDDLVFRGEVYRYSRENYEKEIDNLVYKPKKGDGIYQCRRCKSTKVDSQAVQLRSGDEPSTIFARCEQCGYRWRDS